MSNIVRWGLLSTANINQKLIPPIRASKRGELAAVASRDLRTAQDYAKKWGIPKAFGGYQEMLDSGAVDAVYIGLPNHLHAEWTIKSLQAGVHVLCEKPFALSLDEVDAMIAASRSTGRYLTEAFMYRHHPQTKIVGEWVRSGKLGEVFLVRGHFSFKLTDPQNVRMIPEWGGGSLWDVGVYPMSFAQFVYGEPAKTAFGRQIIGATGVDEAFSGVLTYSGERLAEVSSSFRTAYHTHIDIIGTEGRLVLNRPFNSLEDGRRLTFFSGDGHMQEIAVPTVELYSGEVEDLQNAILDGTPPYLTLEETRNHVRTVLALYESARRGEAVEV